MISGIRRKTIRLSFIWVSVTLIVLAWPVSERLRSISFKGVEGLTETPSNKSQAPDRGWGKIPGGPGTSCSTGGPYFFFVRPGDPQRLLIHFQGGGACWNGVNCDTRQRPTFDPSVDDNDQPKQAGIFDVANPQNPFKDFTMVFVSYCTGDAHLGNRVVTYSTQATDSRPTSTFQIHHEGYPNAMAALRWSFANLPSPKTIFVSGESAGAIASPFFAVLVAAHYSRSKVAQLGDSAGGYRTPAVTKLLEGWGASETIRNVTPYRKQEGAINFETLYTAAARDLPSVRFSQFNTIEDSTQCLFLRLVGVENASLERLLEQNYADIHEASPDFRAFTAPGKTHTILSRPEFYQLEVSGVRFRDWVTDLVMGRPVKNVKLTMDN